VTGGRPERGRPEPPISRARWRKSTYSGGNGECVEVAGLGAAVAVRDSKNPTGPSLSVPPGTWRAFVRSVKTGA
jgi:hypothetical protein